MTASGGISPNDWTNELTELGEIAIFERNSFELFSLEHMKHQTRLPTAVANADLLKRLKVQDQLE